MRLTSKNDGSFDGLDLELLISRREIQLMFPMSATWHPVASAPISEKLLWLSQVAKTVEEQELRTI